jgi:hypothetical protein
MAPMLPQQTGNHMTMVMNITNRTKMTTISNIRAAFAASTALCRRIRISTFITLTHTITTLIIGTTIRVRLHFQRRAVIGRVATSTIVGIATTGATTFMVGIVIIIITIIVIHSTIGIRLRGVITTIGDTVATIATTHFIATITRRAITVAVGVAVGAEIITQQVGPATRIGTDLSAIRKALLMDLAPQVRVVCLPCQAVPFAAVVVQILGGSPTTHAAIELV